MRSTYRRAMARAALWSWVLLAGALPAALAQEYRGNLFLTVVGPDKQPVIGATASLTGQDFTRSQISDAKGEVRFIRLEPGKYALTVTYPEFQPANYKSITVSINSSVQLTVPMAKTVTEEVTVTSATPLLDRRSVGSNTVLTAEELSQVPQVRDPWSVLTTVPGVTTDRINIGGSESGQQSNFAAKGDTGVNSTWTLDGVSVTDNSASGGSSIYYDFNSFAEVAVASGGVDFEQTSPGVHLNFVSKQGTNRFTGSMNMVRATSGTQSDNMPQLAKDQNAQLAELLGPRAGAQQAIANRIDETFEKSVDFSGPIVKDAAWFWFGFDQNDIDIVKKGRPDKTSLNNWSAKVHGTLGGPNTYWRVFYTYAQKAKQGRTGGLDTLAIVAQPDTLWNQSGPNRIYNAEISHFFTPNFQVSLQGAKVESAFGLVPPATGDAVLDVNSVLWNGNIVNLTNRPVKSGTVRGSNFFSTGAWDHELKYGYRYKDAASESISKYSQTGAFGYIVAPGAGYLYLGADAFTRLSLKEHTLWAGDTITKGPLTVVAGLTYVRSKWHWDAGSSSDLQYQGVTIPGVTFGGADPGPKWDNLLPRLGVTYTIPGTHRTLLRAGYSRFADQATLDTTIGGFGYPGNTASTGSHVLVYAWGDQGCEGSPEFANDHVVEPCEWQDAPGAPSLAVGEYLPVNKQDPNLKAPTVDEFTLGAERELMTDFTVGIGLTYRKRKNDLWAPYAGVGPGQYVVAKTFTQELDGKTFTGSFYVPDIEDFGGFSENGLPLPPPKILSNHPNYSETYRGVELTATKRLSNKWMARGYAIYNTWKRDVAANEGADPTIIAPDQFIDGGVAGSSAGSRSGAFRYSYPGTNKWAANVNAMYQLPRDFTVSANVFARQGYVWPVTRRTLVTYPNGYVAIAEFQLGRAEDLRAPTVKNVDLKVTKLVKLGDTTVQFAIEGFNILNENTVLQRNLRAGRAYTGFIYEYLTPRIFRFGASVQF